MGRQRHGGRQRASHHDCCNESARHLKPPLPETVARQMIAQPVPDATCIDRGSGERVYSAPAGEPGGTMKFRKVERCAALQGCVAAIGRPKGLRYKRPPVVLKRTLAVVAGIIVWLASIALTGA